VMGMFYVSRTLCTIFVQITVIRMLSFATLPSIKSVVPLSMIVTMQICLGTLLHRLGFRRPFYLMNTGPNWITIAFISASILSTYIAAFGIWKVVTLSLAVASTIYPLYCIPFNIQGAPMPFCVLVSISIGISAYQILL
jgi:hypothetical protein